MDIAQLGYRVDSSDARRASRDLDRMTDEARQAERQADRLGRSSLTMGRALGVAAGAAGAFFAVLEVRKLIQMADTFTLLEGRIGLFADSAEQVDEVFSGLDRTAFRLGVQIDNLGTLYTRLAPSADALGYSQQNLLDITEAVTTGLSLSGATASEQASVIQQLSQAMQSGTIRGEEFNAINENGGRIMQALADYIGVTRGELRELAFDGRLTSDVVGNALLANLSAFRDEMGEIPETVDRASQAIQGELAMSWKALNDELKITSTLANTLRSIANNLRGWRVGLEFEGDTDAIRGQIDRIDEVTRAYRRAVLGLNDYNAAQRLIGTPTRDAVAAELDAVRLLGRQEFDAIVERAGEAGEDAATAIIRALGERRSAARAALEALLSPPESSAPGGLPPQLTPAGDTPANDLSRLLSDTQTYLDRRRMTEESARREAEYQRQHVEYLRLAGIELESYLAMQAGGVGGLGLAEGTPFAGMTENPSLAGQGFEIANLMSEYQERQAILNQMLEAELITYEQHEDRLTALQQAGAADRLALERATYAMQMSAASSTFDSIAHITAGFAGEQSGIYRAMFSVSKAFAIAESIINIQSAMSKALNFAIFPANIPAMAMVAAEGASIVSAIQAVAGFRSGGYTGDGPMGSVAGVVHGREYVLNARATQAIGRDNLDHMNRYGAPPANDRAANDGGGQVINVHVGTINAGSDVSRGEVLSAIKVAVREGVQTQGPGMVRQTLQENNELSGSAF